MKGNSSEEHLSTAASIVLSVWLSLSGLAAVTGNVVVLWLFYKHESLRTISNRFLASLSVADVFVGLVIDPYWIVIRCWNSRRVQRKLVMITKMLWIHTTAATTLNSCCVSIDRFTAIRFPFRYQDILTKRRCLAVIILVWFISLSLSFPILFFQPGKDRKGLFVSITCTMFLAPLLVVSFCYIIIFKVARKQFGRILAAKKLPDSSENIRARVTQNLKAIKTVGFVLSACIITWMPSVVLQLVKFYYMEEEKRCRLRKLTFVVSPWVEAIAFTSSAINPLIYYFRNSDFRQAFRRTFHWLPCVHEQDASHLRAQPERNRLNRNVGTCGNLTAKETEV
nr:beta-2 adrenergic receptor-like [Pocillopora verrucosa]